MVHFLLCCGSGISFSSRIPDHLPIYQRVYLTVLGKNALILCQLARFFFGTCSKVEFRNWPQNRVGQQILFFLSLFVVFKSGVQGGKISGSVTLLFVFGTVPVRTVVIDLDHTN